jgi:protein O-mannosyl-transferase
MSATPAKTRANKSNGTVVVSRWQIQIAALLIVFGVVLAYANSLSVPFVFDDQKGIVQNETIRSLWPLSEVLSPPVHATGAGGRPIVNLSLALNYAIGGLEVRGYHVFNISVHALAALLLFGLVRRTLLRPVLAGKYGEVALPLSFAVSILWALHPLLTESVTSVIQRTESLGGLFYLLTLYAFVRSVENGKAWRWQLVAIGACLVGMATKEIMATVPVIALLYDRTFVAGTFKAAWQDRKQFYCSLMATWLLLAYLVVINESRGGMVGFGLGMSAWDYALTQCRAILLYLKLSFWPHPLVIDYGAGVSRISEVWLQGIVLLFLVVGTFLALARKPVVGFLAFTFFAILAPSSSFVPLTTQTIAEHRMYLPLAAVLGLVVLGLYARLGKWVIPGVSALALVAGIVTANRNRDYHSVITLWEDTVEKAPDNSRARINLGSSYSDAGRLTEALKEFDAARRLKPNDADAEYNVGNTLLKMERFDEASSHYQKALELNPKYGMAHYGLAYVLIRTGLVEQSLAHLQLANQLMPKEPNTLRTLASSLSFTGRTQEAFVRYEELLLILPDDPVLQCEVGSLLTKAGRNVEALAHFERALGLNPHDTNTRYNLGLVHLQLAHFATAAREFSAVLHDQPNFAVGRNSMGEALMGLERWAEAIDQFHTALRINPNYTEAKVNLDKAELLRDLRRR